MTSTSTENTDNQFIQGKWGWMMDYCQKNGLAPAQNAQWELAEAAYQKMVDSKNNLEEAKPTFMIGQEVMLGSAKGVIVKPENKDLPNTDKEMWVFNHAKGYASRYAIHNIKPLDSNLTEPEKSYEHVGKDVCQEDSDAYFSKRQNIEQSSQFGVVFSAGHKFGFKAGYEFSSAEAAVTITELSDEVAYLRSLLTEALDDVGTVLDNCKEKLPYKQERYELQKNLYDNIKKAIEPTKQNLANNPASVNKPT